MEEEDIIVRANSVSLLEIFRHYGLRIDGDNKKIVCPFSSHKGGRESTASFFYYPDTNTFHCFGCKEGSRCCDFVSRMEGISKLRAAYKILYIFNITDVEVVEDAVDYNERLGILISFSNIVRGFRQDNGTNDDNNSRAKKYIENICQVFDVTNTRYDLSNEALSLVVEQLKRKVTEYK